jgi:thioredoxin 1
MVRDLTSENFESEVLKGSGKILVDFNADWCGPCQMLRPIVDEFAEEHEDVKVFSVNIDDCDEIAYNYQVSAIPCLVVFENGKEITRNIGLMSKKKIEKMIGEK